MAGQQQRHAMPVPLAPGDLVLAGGGEREVFLYRLVLDDLGAARLEFVEARPAEEWD